LSISIFSPIPDLIPNIDPKVPNKPERPLTDDDDFDLEEDCLVCGEQKGVHTTSDVCSCITKGEKQ